MSMVVVRAYYTIGGRATGSFNEQHFESESDADNAAWLCATMPGCVSAQIVKRELVTPNEIKETVLCVYSRNDAGIVEDFTGVYEAIQQLREAGAEFEVC